MAPESTILKFNLKASPYTRGHGVYTCYSRRNDVTYAIPVMFIVEYISLIIKKKSKVGFRKDFMILSTHCRVLLGYISTSHLD